MELTWKRVAHLANDIFPIFEHVHDIPINVRLLDSLPCLMDLDAGYRGRVAVLHLVRRERGDSSFLIGSDLVRECTGIEMKDDNLLCPADGVRAVVSDRFHNQAVDFLGIRLAWVMGHDFRIAGTRDHEKTRTRDHEKKTTVRVEDVDTLRIGAKLVQLAAIRAHLIRGDECPGADELLFERLLLSKGIA